jgi:hypothetical protein
VRLSSQLPPTLTSARCTAIAEIVSVCKICWKSSQAPDLKAVAHCKKLKQAGKSGAKVTAVLCHSPFAGGEITHGRLHATGFFHRQVAQYASLER